MAYKPAKDTPEIKALKAELKRRGIPYHPRHGEKTLKELLLNNEVPTHGVQIEGQIQSEVIQTQREVNYESQDQESQQSQIFGQTLPNVYAYDGQKERHNETRSNGPQREKYDELVLAPGEKLFYTEKEFKSKELADRRKEASRLVRCRITCMNPAKQNWTGEIVSVGSAKMGTFKKFIPYNSPEPYHIPHIIYQELKERKCRIGHIVKLPNGQEVNRYKLVPEFSIEVLPPLTPEELKELARRQALASGSAVAA